ncbi:MAG TPA: hypothetical protein VKP68_19395 [Ramlibacter sp.]|nr:hypothetical protein [Ramlibacter sp.]
MRSLRFLQGLVIATAGISAAYAQQTLHRCSTVSGSTYISERPCSESADPYASESEGKATGEIPLIVDVAPLLKYMSPRCGAQLEELRAARSSQGANVTALSRSYYRECNEEELKAANRLAAEQSERNQQLKGKP